MRNLIKKSMWLLVMTLSALPALAYDFEVDGIYYTKLSDGTSVEVSNTNKTSNGKSAYDGIIVIPQEVNYQGKNYTVTSIGKYAFYYSTVKSVSIPETVETIEQYGFRYAEQMETCNVPNSVHSIGKYAFANCSSLNKINIPNQLKTINLASFYKCTSLKSISIPESVTTIYYSSTTWASSGSGNLSTTEGYPCFADCSSLKEVIFEDGQNPINFVNTWTGSASTGALYANEIFYRCPIETIYLGRTFNNSTGSVFQGFQNLKNITIGPKVISLQSSAFYGCSGLKEVVIPDNINEIGAYAFYGCTNLKTVFIGNGLSSIPRYIFGGCSNLNNLYIGSALEDIDGEDPFYNCNNLKDIYLFSNKLKSISKDALSLDQLKIYVTNPALYASLLSINNLEYIININHVSCEYSGAAPNFSYTNNVEGAVVTFDSPNINVNVGEYNTNIDVTFTIGDWHSTAKIPAKYTITPAPLSVVANNFTRKFGEENPELTYTCFGFKNNETIEVLSKKPQLQTSATTQSNAGQYDIIPFGAEAQNYSFTYERGTLTITKADQTITWDQEFDEVSVGDILELTATSSVGLPIRYVSTDETIADIYTKNGIQVVEFLKPGIVTIRATQEGTENHNEAERVSKSVKVIVHALEVKLNTSSITLKTEESYQITATVLPENTTEKKLTWTSSNPNVATVSETGLVKALATGSTTVKVTCENVSATCDVTVVQPVLGVYLNESTIEIVEDGTFQLIATVVPENAINKNVSWTSSNNSIAMVSGYGTVYGISEGQATISVTTEEGGYIALCKVNVVKGFVPVSQIVFDVYEIEDFENSERQINVIVLPENASNKVLIWQSSDNNVVSVDNNGSIRLIKEGTATVSATATDNSGVKSECLITVKKNSGIEDVLLDDNTSVKVYNLTGSLLFEGKSSDINLKTGFYILTTNNMVTKVYIK